MKQTLKNIWNWVKNPDEVEFIGSTIEKFKFFSRVFIIDVLIALFFVSLLGLIHNYVLKLETSLNEMDVWQMLLFGVLFAPVLEELIFRFPLKYKRNYFARLIDYFTNGWLRNHWGKVFKYFVYLLTIGFGMMHLFNYDINTPLFYALSPIIVGTQLIGGLTLSYTRIKLGFLWGVVQHVVFNFIFVGMVVIFGQNTTMIEESTPEYSIKINGLIFIDADSSRFNEKIVNDKIYFIKANDYSLQAVLDSINLDNVTIYDNSWVDFYFESKEGVSSNEVYELMKKKIRFEEE